MYAQLYRRCDRLDIIIYLQTVLNYINMRYQGKLVNKTAPYTTAHYQLRECLNIDTICPSSIYRVPIFIVEQVLAFFLYARVKI